LAEPHSRPAHLTQPDIAKAAKAERLFERAIDEIDAEPLAVHELRRGGVLRDLGAKRANPAALFHHLTPPQHGLALGESQSHGFGAILPARLEGVEKTAFEFGPEISRPRAQWHGADKAVRRRQLARSRWIQSFGINTLASASMIQSWRAASQPRTQLFSFGLGLTFSSPTITRAGRSGWRAIRRWTRGRTGSAAHATQKIIS
jgi:hypothetical protein